MTSTVLSQNTLHNLSQIVPEFSKEEIAAATRNTTDKDFPYAIVGLAIFVFLVIIFGLTIKLRRKTKKR